jgi:hypothetical protein
VQLSLTFTFYGLWKSHTKDFENVIIKLIENCYNSLFIEINRAYNKQTQKGDFIPENEKSDSSMISTESFDDNMIKSEECIDKFKSPNISESFIKPEYVEINIKDFTIDLLKLEENEISNFYKEIVDCIDNSFSFNDMNEASTFSYSKYSHLFSFTGYTNVKVMSLKQIKNQIPLILNSGILSPENKSQFHDFIIIIIEMEIMMQKYLKDNIISVNESRSKIINLFNKHNLWFNGI